MRDNDGKYSYSIWDPTGNITALVESPVEIPRQPAAAAELMRLHPEVEQVGFVSLPDSRMTEADPAVRFVLRMAGGEFCGNASMCAAALYRTRYGTAAGDGGESIDLSGTGGESGAESGAESGDGSVLLRVSGAADPVEVRLEKISADSFDAAIHMPDHKAIEDVALQYGGSSGPLPLVRLEGISHLIIDASSPHFLLKDRRTEAEAAVRQWCAELNADGLGLMFLEDCAAGSISEMLASEYVLTPLVYVPGSGTVFWENSCASGSAAAGMYLARLSGRPISVSLHEPGGTLRVESDPGSRETWLYGSVSAGASGRFPG